MNTTGSLLFQSLGIIRTPHICAEKGPIQPCFARGVRGHVEVFPKYAEGLQGVDEFTHLWLIYHLHQAAPAPLVVTPFLADQPKGIFACRYPSRPNPIGLSLVKLVRREGHILEVEDVDVLDGTLLLDIKPYVPRFDMAEAASGGWTDALNPTEAIQRGTRLLAKGECLG